MVATVVVVSAGFFAFTGVRPVPAEFAEPAELAEPAEPVEVATVVVVSAGFFVAGESIRG